MESAETVEPSVGSSKVGNAQRPGDGPGFPLEHRAGDPDALIPLGVVPIPDEPVRFLVARPPRASLAGTDVRIRLGLFLVPLPQIRFTLAQNVEDLRLAAAELDGQLAHALARLSSQNHLNPFGETQFLSLVSRCTGSRRRCRRCRRTGRSRAA